MSPLTFRELCSKEVICVCDGARLGFINDVVFDAAGGCVLAFLLPDNKGFTFSRRAKYRIERCDIERIGEDLILVRRYTAVGGECRKKDP